jgi:hypothetical protein
MCIIFITNICVSFCIGALPHKLCSMRAHEYVDWINAHEYGDIFKLFREMLVKANTKVCRVKWCMSECVGA